MTMITHFATAPAGRLLAGLAVPVLLVAVGPGRGAAPARPPASPGAEASTPRFVNVTEEAGVGWVNVYGGDEKTYILEMTGTGVALGDYDGDGNLDLYAVNGWRFGGFPEGEEPRSVLYRNRGDGTFEETTERAGVGRSGWGQGCFFADYDNDGDQDLYLTYYGPDVLFRNDGDGTFTDVTAAAGLIDTGWSTGAAFGDYDLDGDLDLYVAHYVRFELDRVPRPGESKYCRFMGLDVLCGPRGLPAEADRFFRNDGDGTYSDVTEEAGLTGPEYYGFQVLFHDLDGDGLPDIFVADDSTPNLLWKNRGDGTFEEMALPAGVGYSEDGREQAGMGVDAADLDGDGLVDLYVTNFSHDYNTLYMSEAPGFFRDVTFLLEKEPSRAWLGWATKFFDYDNDGDLDLFVANGHIYPEVDRAGIGTSYRQRNWILKNEGGRDLVLDAATGPGMEEVASSRGASVGDFDNDGDLDVVVVNMSEALSLLRNQGGNARNWLGVRLLGRTSNRDGVGATLRIPGAAGGEQAAIVLCGSGYLGTSDRRAHFGLGTRTRVARLEITWPGNKVQVLENLPVNRYITVREDDDSWSTMDSD